MGLKRAKTAVRSIDEIARPIASNSPAEAARFVLDRKTALTKLQMHTG